MKLLVLVFLVSSISISLISGTPLRYDDEKYSFELISIDNLLLTKHDPTLTPHHQQRSLLSAPPVTNQLELFFGSGMTYLMSLGVGTPPQNVYMTLDTGSDITWLQCSPCTKCYEQYYDPIFDPRNSTTFSQVHCGGPRCKQLQGHSDGCAGGKHNKTCLYKATYGSGSFSQGVFSTETLTLGNTTELQNISFGCGHDNQGEWTGDSDGLLGLGRGELSFITQTKDLFQGQFSYCFASPFSNTSNSSIVFGPYVVPDGKDVYYTPLIYTNIDTYYHVNLTAILVNGIPVSGINSSISDVKLSGGVIIDSGTAYTRFVNETYVAFRDAFREAVQNQTNSTVSVGSPGNFKWFDTCYNISSGKLPYVEVPMVELQFDQGANMRLPPDNTVTVMDNNGTVATLCFPFESDDWYTTIGSFQQQTFQMVYDVSGNQIGFVPDSC